MEKTTTWLSEAEKHYTSRQSKSMN